MNGGATTPDAATIRLSAGQKFKAIMGVSSPGIVNSVEAAADFVRSLPSYVEPEVYLLKVAVTRYSTPSHSRIAKEEANKAEIAVATPAIQFGAAWYEGEK